MSDTPKLAVDGDYDRDHPTTAHPLVADYAARRTHPTDINEHLLTLHDLAQDCAQTGPGILAEFGTRSGQSTAALLAGLVETPFGGTLHSYDLNQPDFRPAAAHPFVRWQFHQADTAQLDRIPSCDLLFIDTLHTAAQVEAELVHAPRVSRYLVFHDTVLFGTRDEGSNAPVGICHAIWKFLATAEGWKWTVKDHWPNNNGLLVLQRRHG